MLQFSARPPGARSIFRRPPWKESREGILSALDFHLFLERERSLADRGSRVFSLILLKDRQNGSGGIEKLSPDLIMRLRSTDLVGRLDASRLGILLTDTDSSGAGVVAAWIDESAARLDIQVEPSLYVYPSVAEVPHHEPNDIDGGPPDGTGDTDRDALHGGRNGRVVRRSEIGANGRTSIATEATHATHNQAIAGRSNGAAPAVEALAGNRWPVKDLWPELTVPLPHWKRAFDILASVTLLLLLLPLFVLVAAAIRIDSPGPVIFTQRRAGRGGRPFTFYKFRSMFVDAEHRRGELESLNEQRGPVFKIKNDPRRTRVGRLIRRTSIDELPQLWNVLKGDISLVGPRSPTLNEVPNYERWQRRRLELTGGITCIWQVSGRNSVPFEEWMRMDRRYAARRSVWTDLRLLAKTLSAVVSGRGAS